MCVFVIFEFFLWGNCTRCMLQCGWFLLNWDHWLPLNDFFHLKKSILQTPWQMRFTRAKCAMNVPLKPVGGCDVSKPPTGTYSKPWSMDVKQKSENSNKTIRVTGSVKITNLSKPHVTGSGFICDYFGELYNIQFYSIFIQPMDLGTTVNPKLIALCGHCPNPSAQNFKMPYELPVVAIMSSASFTSVFPAITGHTRARPTWIPKMLNVSMNVKTSSVGGFCAVTPRQYILNDETERKPTMKFQWHRRYGNTHKLYPP